MSCRSLGIHSRQNGRNETIELGSGNGKVPSSFGRHSGTLVRHFGSFFKMDGFLVALHHFLPNRLLKTIQIKLVKPVVAVNILRKRHQLYIGSSLRDDFTEFSTFSTYLQPNKLKFVSTLFFSGSSLKYDFTEFSAFSTYLQPNKLNFVSINFFFFGSSLKYDFNECSTFSTH